MCANASQPASSSPLASTGRSLLSKLTSLSPLKSRNRNLTDFYIRPLEPHRQYSPGDLVKGSVVLTIVKPIRLTHLTVALHGFVRVFKHPNAANDPLPTDSGLTASTHPSKSQYFGNGHASLFQDEVTLCGEGRLEAGVYEFNFELEFPSKGLPTSIDFERGTISYMITSTITRPTSITATSSCDRKVSLVETVDIGPMLPPRPRTISLEPISKRTRPKKTTKNKEKSSQEATDVGSSSDARQPTSSPSPDDTASQSELADRSPVPSDMQSVSGASAESTVSSNTGASLRLSPVPSSVKSARESQGISLADKTITATIELQRSGCLPGDSLPLKISIKHTKPVKSMHGIILTLYRQGRIDSAPPLSLFMEITGKDAAKLKHEEYYPKSKTGLGGLSLMSAGSSSVFRKDLSQTFAPLIVDPTTLTAVVNASVRVPEDVFPTISGVPGEMISFRYQLEVVVDLGGKLASHQRHLPRLGTVTLPAKYGPSTSGGDVEESLSANRNMLAAWGGSIVDTEHIRREKSVVACVFEVIVGTTDSARKRGRANNSVRRERNNWVAETPATATPTDRPTHEESFQPGEGQEQPRGDQQCPYDYYDQQYDQNYDQYTGYYGDSYGYDQSYESYQQYPPPTHDQMPIPPPNLQPEDGLGEKERVRRAEERLLPSQPPQDDDAGPSSSRAELAPSAPQFVDEQHEEDLYSADDQIRPSTTQLTRLPTAPSAPHLEDLTPNTGTRPIEDKQELERRRLLAEASAPPEFPPDDEDDGGAEPNAPPLEPSAPVLTEEDEYGGQYSHDSLPGSVSQQESLPRYER